ncbi:hypothetical protein [Bradyrhizobium sp.]|uniref:hypothetical protein n=1 Tax=Bradyrhizobium sp. TaxID=376 RepID=UPI0039E6C566
MKYQPSNRTLIDGRIVLDNSEEWRMECYVRHIALLDSVDQSLFVEKVGRMHGYDTSGRLHKAALAMLNHMHDEAHMVAELTTQEARREALAAIKARGSDVHAQHVEAIARKIFAARLQ